MRHCNTSSSRLTIKGNKRWAILAAAVASVGFYIQPTRAATFTWDGGGGTDKGWGTATNWNADGIPGSGTSPSTGSNDIVNLSSTSVANIDLGGVNRSIDQLNFSANSSSNYSIVSTVAGGALTLNSMSQTADDSNAVQVPVYSYDSSGTGKLTINVTSNTLQLQKQVSTGSGGLQKDGGYTLKLGTSGTNFDNAINGNIVINGGALEAHTPGGTGANLNPLGGTGNVTMANGTTLALRYNASFDYVRDVVLNGSGTISVDRASGGSLSGQIGSVGAISMGGSTLTVSGANSYSLAADSLAISGSNTATIAASMNMTVGSLSATGGAAITKTGSGTLTVNSDNSANVSGPINVYGGGLTITTAGGAGSGVINVGTSAINGGGFLTQTGRLDYVSGSTTNSTVTPNVTVDQASQVNITSALAASDTITVKSGGIISGSVANMSGLAIGSSVNIANGAVVAFSADPGSTLPTGLAEKSVYLGLSGDMTTTGVTIGAGTPWLGLSNDRSARKIVGTGTGTPAVITVNGGDGDNTTIEATLQGMNGNTLSLGATSGATVSFASGSGAKATLAIKGLGGTSIVGSPGGNVQINNPGSSSGLSTAVDKIIVQSGTLWLNSANALDNVPVEVQSGGGLDISQANSIDGDVTVKSGGIFMLNDNFQLTGSGKIVLEGGATLGLHSSTPTNILSSTQQISLQGTGHTIRVGVSEIVGLDNFAPDDATFVFNGGTATTPVGTTLTNTGTITYSGGLTLDGGTLTNDGSDRLFTGPITVGANGARFAATTTKNLVLSNAIDATGKTITIGSLTPIDYQTKANSANGTTNVNSQVANVIFSGGLKAGTLNWVSGNLGLDGPDCNINGDISTGSNILYLAAGGTLGSGLQGELTPRLTSTTGNVADRVADHIIIGNNGRVEMGVQITTSNGSRLDVTQPFIIDTNAGLNPGDIRNMYVSRSGSSGTYTAGTDTGVNFTDITMRSGSQLAVNESNTDVRVALKLAGNATTAKKDDFDFVSINRDASLPAFDGTNYVVLTQGRPGETNVGQILYGSIGAGVQINQVKGTLRLVAGSSLDPSVVINNLGAADLTTTTYDGGVNIYAGSDGTTASRINTGTVNLAGGQEVQLFTDEIASGSPLINATNMKIVVAADQVGTVQASRNLDNVVLGYGWFKNVELGQNATLRGISSNDGSPVADVTLTGTSANWQVTTNTAGSPLLANVTTTGSSATINVIGTQTARLVGKLDKVDLNITNTGITYLTQRDADLATRFDLNGRTVDARAGTLSINSMPGTGTINVWQDAAAEIRANTTGSSGSNFLSATTLNIKNARSLTALADDQASGTAYVNTIGTPINMTGANNVLVSDRNNTDAAVNGNVLFSTVNSAGGMLELHQRNGIGLSVGTINFASDASLSSNGAGAIKNINAGANRLTVTGGTKTTVTGNLTAGNVMVGGAVGLEFDPGAAATSNVSATSLRVDTLLSAKSGTTEIGNTIISSASANTYVAGLREGRITGTNNIDTTTANPRNFGIQLSPRMGLTNNKTTAGIGWNDNETWVYTGQVYDADGLFTFAEHIDDDVQIKINGQVVLLNENSVGGKSSSSTVTTSGSTAGLNTDGTVVAGANYGAAAGTKQFTDPDGDNWYDIEIRLQNGTGSAGPASVFNGFHQFYGLGFSSTGATTTNGADYTKPVDDGTMNLFRTQSLAKGNVSVEGGATLNAGGLSNIGKVLFPSAGTGTMTLTGSGAAVASSADSIDVSTTAAAVLNVARAEDSVTVSALNVGSTASFTKKGLGTLAVTGTGTGNGAVTVAEGIMVIDGNIPGAVSVLAGASLSGHGTVGALTIQSTGEVCPGGSIGAINSGNLSILSGGVMEMDLTSAGQADVINVTGTVNLAGELRVVLQGAEPGAGSIPILLNDGTDAVTGTFAGLVEGATVPGTNLSITYQYDGNGDGNLNDVALVSSAVPEPGSLGVLIGGLSLLGLGRRRRRPN